MPRYEYTCPSCHVVVDRITSIAERDNQMCATPLIARVRVDPVTPNAEVDGLMSIDSAVGARTMTVLCGAKLERTEIASSQVNLTDKRWGMKAILGDGQRVEGSFGVGRSRNFKGFM